MSMDEPNCQTASRMMTHRAAVVLPSHANWMPRSLLTRPSTANMRFHRMATATEEPRIEGR